MKTWSNCWFEKTEYGCQCMWVLHNSIKNTCFGQFETKHVQIKKHISINNQVHALYRGNVKFGIKSTKDFQGFLRWLRPGSQPPDAKACSTEVTIWAVAYMDWCGCSPGGWNKSTEQGDFSRKPSLWSLTWSWNLDFSEKYAWRRQRRQGYFGIPQQIIYHLVVKNSKQFLKAQHFIGRMVPQSWLRMASNHWRLKKCYVPHVQTTNDSIIWALKNMVKFHGNSAGRLQKRPVVFTTFFSICG